MGNAGTTVKNLVVLLVKPTKYDQDGYLLQFLKGVLPSNSVAAMYGITKAAFESPEFADLDCIVQAFDETVRHGHVNVKRLMAKYRAPNTTVVVGLVAVQTNQFPRAVDLAHAFQKEGASVVMGGFHVSGSIAMLLDGENTHIPCPKIMPPELQQLMDEGVILVHGEAEKIWGKVLLDIVRGEHQLLYRGGRPPLTNAPFPRYPVGYFKGFFAHLHTMDTGRGCPFHCSFCTIINVQGNDRRYRNVAMLLDHVRKLAKKDTDYYTFFVDDNFARNPYWEDILLGLAKLRREGYHIHFMIEADLAAWKLRGEKSGKLFAELLAEAGCTQVFLGVESLRQKTLRAANKYQNQVAKYREMCAHYHRYGIALHAAFIIGFPADTPETIREDVQKLREMGFDQASFFILTPIPGSEDHARRYVAGLPMDEDFNDYDSFQPVMPHPKMTREELKQSYDQAWKDFYTPEAMAAALLRVSPLSRKGLARNHLWYLGSVLAEHTHPMIAGFYRFRRWRDRRPSAPRISYARHVASEISRHFRYVRIAIRMFYMLQDVRFRTNWLPRIQKKIQQLNDARAAMGKRLHTVRAYERLWRMRVAKAGWFTRTFGWAAHRAWLNSFWQHYASQRWNLLIHPRGWVWHLKMLRYVVTEVVYTIRFGTAVASTLLRITIAGSSSPGSSSR